MNGVQLVGRIASQIQSREIPTRHGLRPVATFLLAVPRPVRDAPEPEWVRVETWGVHADNLVAYCSKGSRIAVSGHLRGQFVRIDGFDRKQLRVAVVADTITYLGTNPDGARDAVSPDAQVDEEDGE